MEIMRPVVVTEGCCAPIADTPPQLLLAKDTAAPKAARDHGRQFVSRNAPEVAPDALDDFVLIVSELVTNAVRYGTEPGDSVMLTFAARSGLARVEVADPVRRHPRRRDSSGERGRGRGLWLLENLATRWGVEDRQFGKAVWAEVAW